MNKNHHNSRRTFLKKLGSTTALVAGSSLAWDATASNTRQLFRKNKTLLGSGEDASRIGGDK